MRGPTTCTWTNPCLSNEGQFQHRQAAQHANGMVYPDVHTDIIFLVFLLCVYFILLFIDHPLPRQSIQKEQNLDEKNTAESTRLSNSDCSGQFLFHGWQFVQTSKIAINTCYSISHIKKAYTLFSLALCRWRLKPWLLWLALSTFLRLEKSGFAGKFRNKMTFQTWSWFLFIHGCSPPSRQVSASRCKSCTV